MTVSSRNKRIRQGVSTSKSLRKETGLVNVSPSQSDLKCYGILLPAMLASRNKVICGYWLLSSDLCKTSWIFLHGPVCPKTGSVLSRNVVRSVLKPGPFLYWNVVRFVLRRGPFCPETWSVLSGPFCPWSVLSEYRTDILRYWIGKKRSDMSHLLASNP